MQIIRENSGPNSGSYNSATQVGPSIRQCWRRRVGGPISGRYLALGDRWYGATHRKRGVAAWSLADGKRLWAHETVPHDYGLSLTVSAQFLYCFGYYPDTEERSFRTVWFDPLTGEALPDMQSKYQQALFSIADTVTARSGTRQRAFDGKTLEDVASVSSKVRVGTPPIFVLNNDAIGRVSVAPGHSTMGRASLDTGELHWQFRATEKWVVPGVPENGYKANAAYTDHNCMAVCLAGDAVVVTPNSGPSYWNGVLDVHTGELLWELPRRHHLWSPHASVFADADRKVLVGTEAADGYLHKIWSRNLYTGALQWERRGSPDDDPALLSESFFVTGDILWHIAGVGAKERFLVARDVDTGEELNRIPIEGANPSVEWAEDGKLLVRAGDYLYCYASA